MDALLTLRRSHAGATDWAAAAVSGFAAGAVLMVLDLVWSSIFNAHGPWRTSHMIAPLIIGTDTLRTTGYAFNVWVVSVALAIHYVLGIAFGLVMAAVMVRLRADATPGRAAAAGSFLGLVLYMIKFAGLPLFFPLLVDLRGGETLAAHVVFGLRAGGLYWKLKRTPGGA